MALKDVGEKAAAVELVHAHHVLPLEFGGADAAENMVLLCPNHHGIAHALGRAVSASGKTRYWSGPRTREALLHEMRLLHSADKAAWRAWIAGGRDYEQHLRDELIRQTRAFTLVKGAAS